MVKLPQASARRRSAKTSKFDQSPFGPDRERWQSLILGAVLGVVAIAGLVLLWLGLSAGLGDTGSRLFDVR